MNPLVRPLARLTLAAALTALTACSGHAPAPSTLPAPDRGASAAPAAAVDVGLRDLVLDDGSPLIGALAARLTREGVPFDRVKLTGSHDPLVGERLATRDAQGVHARYAGVIAPSLTAAGLSQAERSALAAYRETFGVRLLTTGDAATASPATPVDGIAATVTEAGRSGPFSYLNQSLAFDPAGDSSMTATLAGKPSTLPADAAYTPLVTASAKGASGALVALVKRPAGEEMRVNLSSDGSQSQFQVLAHGMITWLNRSVSTSYNRNYFSVQVDDVLLPDSQWDADHQCETGRNCPEGVSALEPIRMSAEDVSHVVAWQRANGDVKVEFAMNGAGAGQYAETHGGSDPLMEAIVANKDDLRIVSHTWSHLFMGCVQKLFPDTWRCLAAPDGQPQWHTMKELRSEIQLNQAFFAKNRLENYNPDELVTGEHSGLAKPPEQVQDNPNLAAAYTEAGITWTAADASEVGDFDPRRIGPAMTVPRYPINIGYDTPTGRQVAAQYNWNNVSKANGGSGRCESDPTNRCSAPIKNIDTGFHDVVVPQEAGLAYQRIVNDDARMHYVHQTNLTGERTLFPILDATLAQYRATFSSTAPLINPNLSQAGTALVNAQAWAAESGQIEARVSGRRVTVTNKGPSDAHVPLTLPDGAETIADGRVADVFGDGYQSARSAWVKVAPGESVQFQIPDAGFATQATWPAGG